MNQLALATPNELHARIVGHAKEAVLLAALIGLQLAEKRRTIPHGEWEAFVEATYDFTPRSALNYLDTAERATEVVTENGRAFGFGEEDSVHSAVVKMINSPGADHRDAFLSALRKPKPALPAPQPEKPRAPRPPAPPAKVASRYAKKVRTAPSEVRDALFTELRPEFEAWLQTHRAA